MRTSVYLPNGQIQPMHGPSVSKLEFQRAQWCAWLRTALQRHLVLHPSSGQVRPERALGESLCSLFSWLQNVIQILTFLMCASLDFFLLSRRLIYFFILLAYFQKHMQSIMLVMKWLWKLTLRDSFFVSLLEAVLSFSEPL